MSEGIVTDTSKNPFASYVTVLGWFELLRGRALTGISLENNKAPEQISDLIILERLMGRNPLHVAGVTMTWERRRHVSKMYLI